MTFMFQEFLKEGSSSPCVARLMMGIFDLRDQVIQSQADRVSFDELYDPVLGAANVCRKATVKIVSTVDHHRTELQKVIVRKHGGVTLPESIDAVLSESVDALLVNGVIAIKSLQEVVRPLGIDIGSLFAKQANFEKGMVTLRAAGHASLADFLSETRSRWSESLVKRRDELEHAGWTLPRCGYRRIALDAFELVEPHVDGFSVTTYSQRMRGRILSFIENVMAYAFQSFCPDIAVVEIPVSEGV